MIEKRKGYILFALLIFLLLAARILLVLKEDDFSAQLLVRQLSAEKRAQAVLSGMLSSLMQSESLALVCYADFSKAQDFEYFWQSHPGLCQKSVQGYRVDYAWSSQLLSDKAKKYVQYTARIKTQFSQYWLQAVKEENSGEITAWLEIYSP